MRLLSLLLVSLAIAPFAVGQAVPGSRDLELRDRFEQVLARSPHQEQAFDRAFHLWGFNEGIEAWDQSLQQPPWVTESPVSSLIVRARIAARLFDAERAVNLLEQAREAGAEGPDFALMLGRLYHDIGRDEEAVSLLEGALNAVRTPEERSRVSRLLGNLLLRSGQREEAIAAWERIAEGAESDTFVLEELAILYETQRMWPEAVTAWTRIVEQSEGDAYLRCRALRAIGDAERARGDFRAAAEAYREGLDWVAPGNWLFDALAQGWLDAHTAMEDLPGLARSLEGMLQSDPTQTEYRLLLGQVYQRLRDWDSAETAYREAIARAPSRQAGYDALVRLQEARGDAEGIVTAYREAIQRFPRERDYHRRLGEALLRVGEREAALDAWREAIGPTPEAADHATLAQWFEGRGFREEARQAYADAVAMEPRRAWSMRLAALEYETGRRDEARDRWLEAGADASADELLDIAGALDARGFHFDAEAMLARAREVAPTRMDLVLAHADVLLSLAEFDAAEAAYEHLQENATSDFHRMRGERGWLDVIDAQGRLSDTRSAWERQIAEEKSNIELRLRLAQLCERMGDRGRALALYRECAAIDPENPELLHRLARVYESVGIPNEAIAAYRRLIELDPGRAGGYYRELVPLLAQHGSEADAIAAAERVVEGAPNDPEARSMLARVYERYQRTEPMLEALQAAVRLAPDEPAYFEAFGRALLAAESPAMAREAFRAMLNTGRDASVRLRAVQLLSDVHAAMNLTEELVHEFEGRIQSAPRDLENYEMLATVHRTSGQPREALAVLERAAVVSDDRESALRRVLIEAHSAGQLETVVRAFEELERMAAELAPREWEQLGRSYAQLGRLTEAERTWDRMLVEHGHDPTVLRAYIRVVREHGFQEPAVVATERLLDLQPFDFSTRLEFAQQLAAMDRVDSAMEQLRMLIRLGPGVEEEKGEEGEAQAPPTSGQGFQIPPHLAVAMAQMTPQVDLQALMGIGLAPGGGAFPAVERQAIHYLAQYALRQGEADALVQEYEALIAAQPDAIAIHHDLLLILITLNRVPELIDHVNYMTDRFDSEVEVIRLAARILEAHRKYDEALAMYERLHDAEVANDPMRRGTRIRLLTAAGRREEAYAEVAALRADFPNHVGVLRQAASQMAALEDLEQAEELYRAVAEADARHRQTALQEMAHHYRNRGLTEDAARIYAELIFVPPPPGVAQAAQPAGFPSPYLLQSGRLGVSHSAEYVVRTITHRFDWPRLDAFQQSISLSSDSQHATVLLDKMRAVALSEDIDTDEERLVALEVTTLLAAYAIEQGKPDEAMAWTEHLTRHGASEETLLNLRLFALEAAQDTEGLRTLFRELAEKYPQEAEPFRMAEARLALEQGDYEGAEERMAAFVRNPERGRDVVGMIRQLFDAGEFDRAGRLLDTYLDGPNPMPDAYGMRIQIKTAMNEHDEATRLARESWEYTISQRPMARAGRMGQIRSARELQGSPMAQLLLSTYRSAGREEELVRYMEAQLANDPASHPIQLDMAHLYASTGRQREAFQIYRDLVARRPGDTALRLAYAQLLAEQQRDGEAYALFDEALRSNPSLYREHAWTVRQVYDRLGKSRELAALEQRMALATTDPRALQQTAQEALNSGNIELACLLFERLVRMMPNEDAHRFQWAEALRKAGRFEDALAAWEDYIRLLETQPERASVAIAQAVPIFAFEGRIHELESLAAQRLEADPEDILGLLLEAGMAQHNKEYALAFGFYRRVLDLRSQDPSILEAVVSMARLEQDYDAAIAVLLENSRHQNFPRWGELGELYAAMGDSEQAVLHWQRDASRHSGPQGIEQAMRRMVEYGMYAEAIAYFDQQAPRVKTAGGVYNNFLQHALRAYLRGGDAPEEWVRSLLRDVPRGQAWLLSGLIQGNEGTLERRRQLMRWALDESPSDEQLVQFVVGHVNQGWRDEEALALVEKLVEIHPRNSDAHTNYTQVLTTLGRREEALSHVTRQLDEGVTAGLLNQAMIILQYEEEIGGTLDLRDRYWHELDADEQSRMTARWAYAFAVAGELEIAMASLREQNEASPTQSNYDRYIDMLFRNFDGREGLAAFESALDDGLFSGQGHVPVPVMQLWAATGRLDDLLALVRDNAETAPPNLVTSILQNMLGNLRSAGADGVLLRGWIKSLEEEEAIAPSLALISHDAALRAGMTKQAALLLDLGLAAHPSHPDLLQRRANALRDAGDLAGAKAVLEIALENAPPSRRENVRRSLLEAYAALGDDEQIDRSLLQTMHLLPTHWHEFGHNGNLLARAGRHAEAADAWRRSAMSPQQPERAKGEQAASLAWSGDVGAALAMYKAEPALPQAATTLAGMLEHGHLDAAMELALIASELQQNLHPVYSQLLTAAFREESIDKAVALIDELRSSVNFQGAFINETVHTALRMRTVDDAVTLFRAIDVPELWFEAARQLGYMAAQEPDPATAEAILAGIAAELQAYPDAMVTAADALLLHERKEPAHALFHDYTVTTDFTSREAIVVARLAMRAGAPVTADLFLHAFTIEPRRLLDAPDGVAYLAQHRPEVDFSGWLSIAREEAIHPERFVLVEAALAAGRGDIEDAKAKLAAMEPLSRVRSRSLEAFALWLALHGQEAALMPLAMRVAEGGVQRDERYRTLETAFQAAAGIGDARHAVALLESLLWLGTPTPWDLIEKAASEWPEDMRDGAAAQIAASRESLASSPVALSLAYLELLLATNTTVETVEDAWKLAPWQSDQLRLARHAPRSWWVSPRHAVIGNGEPSVEPGAILQRNTPLDTAEGWQHRVRLPNDPARLPAAFTPDLTPRIEHHGVYLATDVHSPDTRTVRFASSADDWHRVWVNGDEVFRDVHGGALSACEDSYEVSLRTGQNRVVVWLGNAQGTAALSLGILHNGNGVEFDSSVKVEGLHATR
mgnify:CR=1 FL=1